MAIPVKLPVFEGPLDLLMHLIEKNKIDIYDIPIVEITDQYLEYVHQMDHEDMDVTSEFLVMAATLLDIKSRMLLPREKDEETGEEEADPREELVRRLLEYKMYKYLSEELAVCREEAGGRFFRAQNLPKEVRSYQPPIDYDDLLRGADLQTLQKVFGEVLRRKKSRRDPIRSGFGKIKREEVSMDTKSLYIRAYLQAHPRTDFRALLESGSSREEVIVTFLILLELMKTQKVFIIQDNIGGRILIEAAGPKTGAPNTDAGEDPAGDTEPGPVTDGTIKEAASEMPMDEATHVLHEETPGSHLETAAEEPAVELTGDSPEETVEEPAGEFTEDSDFPEEPAEQSFEESSEPRRSTSSTLALSAVRVFRGVERIEAIAPIAPPAEPIMPMALLPAPFAPSEPVAPVKAMAAIPVPVESLPAPVAPATRVETNLATVTPVPPVQQEYEYRQEPMDVPEVEVEAAAASDTLPMQEEITGTFPPHFSARLWHGSISRFMPGTWKRERLSRLWARRRFR